MRRFKLTAEVRRLRNLQDGATAIEYALIAAGISIAIVVGVTTLGGKLVATWTLVANIFS
jgi:pilus assembly protein Flp/PilA